jgi:hypothetical protein
MSDLKFTKPTDQENEITLDSYLISAEWEQSLAYVGQKVFLEIYTSFVGQEAPIAITGKSLDGQSLGTIRDTISDDYYRGEFSIPKTFRHSDPIYFEAELSDNSLWGQSEAIQVLPMPNIKNLKWSKDKAEKGDILTLSATVTNVREGTRAFFVIYNYDSDEAHERVAEIPTIVESADVSIKWQYQYHADRYDVPTYPQMEKYCGKYENPRYFFVVRIGTEEYGHDDRPFIDIVIDWVNLAVTFKDKRKAAPVQASGPETRVGLTDENGFVEFQHLKPGKYNVSIAADKLVRLRLHDDMQRPAELACFHASWKDGDIKDTCDVGGWADIHLPSDAEVDAITLEWGGASHGSYPYHAEVKLDVQNADTGLQAKLHNLGYQESNYSLEEAVCQFQIDYGIFDEVGLKGDGTLPSKTRAELSRIYGADCQASPMGSNNGYC